MTPFNFIAVLSCQSRPFVGSDSMKTTKPTVKQQPANQRKRPHEHLSNPFGNGWFALKAEAFARFFGTPIFL